VVMGSGRRVCNIKKTTACYYHLDVRRWQRDGLLAGGQFFVLAVDAGRGCGRIYQCPVRTRPVILSYGHRETNEEAWHTEQYPVWLERTLCNTVLVRAVPHPIRDR
jgi:hypothetical protein